MENGQKQVANSCKECSMHRKSCYAEDGWYCNGMYKWICSKSLNIIHFYKDYSKQKGGKKTSSK